jgi:membrane fusion protein
MRAATMSRDTRKPSTSTSAQTRARKRAAFLATIREAAHTEFATARRTGAAPPAPRPPARETTIVASARPATKPAPATPPQPAPARAPAEAAPARAEPAQAAPAQAAPRLFRDEALRHRLSFEEGRGLVRVSPPWTWALLWVLVSAVGVALVASFVGHVEVTGRGRGILRPTLGVRALTSQLSGTVTRVEARSGDRVTAGAMLLRIESPSVQAQLLEADRELEALKNGYSNVSSQQDQHYAEQIDSLRAREKRIVEQIASLRGSVQHFQRRVQADLGLLAKGLVSDLAVSESRDALAQAERQLGGAEQTLDQTRQELASLEARRGDEVWNRQQLVATAQNKRDALALVLQQSVVQAPQDGTVEALLVKPGEVVQAGQVLGKLVPVDSPLEVVSFLAERDRAFAKPGDEVELELDQLPHAQYGTLKARIVRIGDDLASPAELHDALGEEQQKLMVPSYRVELEITDARAADDAHVKLRTGGLMNVRYTLRRERLATLVLSPLKRWFR